MKGRILTVALLTAFSCTSLFAQLQTPDGDGAAQSTALKKISKKAKYGAYLIEEEFDFSTGKGMNDQPVVTARDKGTIEMVSLEKGTPVGYLLPYNDFVKLRDYDFEIFYRKDFKSQKYPPLKMSLTDDDIFFDDSYGLYYGFEAAESGQRCRFKYDYQYTDAKYLTRLFFHQGIPVKQRVFRFKVPSWLQLTIDEKNFGYMKIKKETRKEGNFTIYTYTAENLQAMKAEPSSLGKPYYLPHLIITVRSFSVDNKSYAGFKTVDDLYSWYSLLYQKAQNDKQAISNQVEELTKGLKTDEEKIRAIYYWVQDNIRYIAFEEGYAGFVPHTVQQVFRNKYGDCKGMANLLTEMLKLAGYDAHFAWVGTREIPYDHNEVQSLCVDNHAISVLYFQGKTWFLDGTEKYAPFGVNAYRIQGKTVLVEHGDKCKVERVPAANLGDNTMQTTVRLKLDGDKLKGHVKMQFVGEAKNFFHYVYNNIPSNKRNDFLKNLVELNNNNTDVTNLKTSDFKNRDIPLVVEGDVEVSNQVTKVDKVCYTSMDFFPGTFSGFIPDEERLTPIDLDHIFVASDEVILELPANAKPKQLPELFRANFKENTIEATYSAEKNTIVLRKKMQLSTPVIMNDGFTEWKAFLTRIKEYNRNNVSIQLP
ncbi:transglutaminase-like domain-containing protein [Flavihumibacter petaseus]|uniref:Uncharacterized protein n=1 Tax=Flavihumibacter petaseus NBRC 106054 TaxID=1220578 RepID=A0A0E9N438_9BACT|nr:transglutaminase-like domain-containing protein [Flavihumibacter petaseus]GAO44589.1 hypothetical protein FPE01S_03_06270 [Flavihumibacter petaseus NBRC 106054]